MNIKNKRALAVGIAILIIAVSLLVVFNQSLVSSNNGVNARVACMGDSITNITGYPADLQELLGSGSKVGNFGYDGAAVNFQAERTYFGSESFVGARLFQPTTVVIMLGTNDARTNLNDQIDEFVHDYEFMIGRIVNGSHPFVGQPKIYLVIPPPIFENNINLTSSIFTEQIIPKIRQVASDLGLPLIDVYTPLVNHPEDFSDGVHPNAQGTQIIANTIYQAIKS